MYLNKHVWIFGSTVALALVVLNLPERVANRFKLAMGGLFLPLLGISQTSGRVAETLGNSVIPRADLLREMDQLRRENQSLRFQLTQTQETVRENERLRQQIGWQRQTGWKLKPVRVIGRDPANWWRTVTIDAGSDQGVCDNAAILTEEGLIGRVSELHSSSARVVLLGDPKCRVAAAVPEAKDSGIISPGPAGIWDHQFVTLGYLSRGAELRPGQRVFTSGMGGIFHRGIPIGQILDIHSVDGLYMEARVKLAANLSALDEVWVWMQ
ncbi:MAG: rod shape-determining protein MreC [Verrucomicrobiota bacterium]